MKNTCFNQKKVGDDGKKKVKHQDRTKKKLLSMRALKQLAKRD